MRTISLGELGQIVSGATPRTGVSDYWDGDIPWVTPADLSDHEGIYFHRHTRRITAKGLTECSANLLPPNTILFSSRAPIGHSAVTTFPLCTNQGFKSIIAGEHLDPVFGYFALQWVTPTIIARGRGATFAEVTKEIMEEIELPFCDIPEQRRIAAQLEQADRLRRTRRYTLDLSDTFLPATFRRMFGDDVQAFKKWEVRTLDECCARITDGTHLTPKFEESGVPFVFVKNISNGEISFETEKFVSDETFHELTRRCPIETNDVLYTIVGATYGQAVVVKDRVKFAFQRHVAHLKPDSAVIDPVYLGTMMQFPIIKRQADVWARGAAQPTINLKELRDFRIPLPPLAQQRAFAAIVAQHERLRATQRESLRQAEHLFQTLLHRAFTA